MPILCPTGGNDKVYTPDGLATKIVQEFKPWGDVLEPCKGGGAFVRALQGCLGVKRICTCEIDEGEDFFDWEEKVDWIVTNPPWSQFRKFLKHSLTVSNRVLFLVTLNHFQTKARIRDLEEQGAWITKVLLLDTPKEFPQSGFQLCAALVERTTDKVTTFIRS